MLGNGNRALQRDTEEINEDIFQKAVLNNEYLQIVKDPDFSKRTDINFL